MSEYWKFLRECFWATYETWRRHEEATVIGVVLLTLLAAVISTLVFPLHFKDSIGGALLVGLGFWFVFLFVFGSPYLLWKRQKERINELEVILAPKVGVTFRVSPDSKYCELIARNTSGTTVHGVNIELANVRRNSVHIKDINDLMTSNTGNECPLTLNPGDVAYFQFASRGPRRNGEQSIQLYAGKDLGRQHFTGANLEVKFNVSAMNMLRTPFIARVSLSKNDVLSVM